MASAKIQTQLDEVLANLAELKGMMEKLSTACPVASTTSKKGGAKRPKREKDPNEPKRPGSGYLLFINDKETKESYEKQVSSTGAQRRVDLLKLMRDDWNGDEKIKTKWNEVHKKKVEEYQQAMAKYQASKEQANTEETPTKSETEQEDTPSDKELAEVLGKRRGGATKKGKAKATANVSHLTESESE